MNPLTWLSGPYALFVKIGLVVALIGSVYAMGYTKGNKRATADCEAAKVAELKKYQAAYQKAVERANLLAQKNVKTVEVIRNRTRTIRIKEKAYAAAKPLPDVCVLDDDRVRNINDAIANKESDTGKPDSTVPAATPAE